MKKKETRSIKKALDSKILKYAWISGIIIAVLVILNSITYGLEKNNIYFFIFGLFFQILIILFIAGFYVIGKRYENKLLKIVSILTIAFVIIFYIVFSIYMTPALVKMASISAKSAVDYNFTDLNNLNQEQQELFGSVLLQNPDFISAMRIVVVNSATYFISWIVLSILFGVALIKLRDRVVYSKIAGILQIIGAATLIIFGLGAIVLLAAYIYEFIILYRESKK